VRTFLQIAGEEHAKLAGRKIRPVTAHQSDNGVAQDAY
jgi:hypothetical protein